MNKSVNKKHEHNFVHKDEESWYLECECGKNKFLGLGDDGDYCYACHSTNQKECLYENGGMHASLCINCPEFY